MRNEKAGEWVFVALMMLVGLSNGWLVVFGQWHWFKLVNVMAFLMTAVASGFFLSYMKHRRDYLPS